MHGNVSKLGRFAVRAKSTLAAAQDYPSYVLNATATEVSTLKNGLKVASEATHGNTATIGVWVGAGSRAESDKTNGAARFVEHLALQQTANRTHHQLRKEIGSLGGHVQACTGHEQTVYYAKVFKKDVPRAMDLLGDIVQNAKIDEEIVERECQALVSKLQHIGSHQQTLVMDRLQETAYMGQPLGRTILGAAENIENLKAADLKEYLATNYTAPRMVVAGAGAVDHAQLVELAQKGFGNMPKVAKSGVKAAVNAPVRFVGSDVRMREDQMPIAHVAIAFEGFSSTSEHAFPQMIMQTILGSWDRSSGAGMNMSSKLGQIVSHDKLAHSYSTFNTCYKDTSLFGVYAIADKFKLNDLAWYTMESMMHLVHKTTEEDVELAKTQLKAKLFSQLDGSSAICHDIGRQMLAYGRRLTAAELFARIDAVDAAAVRTTADEVINDKEHVLSALGPIHELPDYNFIRRRSYWVRY